MKNGENKEKFLKVLIIYNQRKILCCKVSQEYEKEIIAEFTRQCENKIVTSSICNKSSIQQKQNRLAKKSQAEVQYKPIDNEYNKDDEDNKNDKYTDINSQKKNDNELLYEVSDFVELVSFNFRDKEENNDGKVEFSIIIKIENELFSEEILSTELNFDELLSPQLDYKEMLLPK
ncbi:20998_t:CDS:2 [Gigaspora margarita]|uniref:20998_t:CDS:1 n=1 Tax=Gigaspora margarita TaxID=4874 RepID=A0ABN7V8J0_GIGMA|nr:20998_t:CDS:2 [Gigaspora margarita]